MTRVEHTTAIGPPIDEIFDFNTEPLNRPVWLSRVLDVHHEPPVHSADEAEAESS